MGDVLEVLEAMPKRERDRVAAIIEDFEDEVTQPHRSPCIFALYSYLWLNYLPLTFMKAITHSAGFAQDGNQ